MNLKILCISDTHTKHSTLDLEEADVLVHTGDYSFRGSIEETEDFANWLDQISYKFKHIIFVPGNHDFIFQDNEEKAKAILPKEVIYLNDSGVEIEGFKFWGSPITPTFFDWAFMKDRGMDIKRHWIRIPSNTDVLLTHGPPQFILDKCPNGNVGCADLADEVLNEVKPLLHVFGHIHESYGTHWVKGTQFVNAAVCDGKYRPRNKPILVEIQKSSEES